MVGPGVATAGGESALTPPLGSMAVTATVAGVPLVSPVTRAWGGGGGGPTRGAPAAGIDGEDRGGVGRPIGQPSHTRLCRPGGNFGRAQLCGVGRSCRRDDTGACDWADQ